MNLQRPNGNEATLSGNRSRSVVPGSGICTRCVDGCRGNCEIFRASFRGRELIYPAGFGEMTAGADKDYPVDYSHLNIQGYAMGAKGLPKGIKGDPDTATFPAVDTETEYGWSKKVKLRVPMFTGALGSTEIARKNWEHFAVGAAISGVTLVCGENVCGIDPELKRDKDGKVTSAPDMDRRIETYKRFHDGYGEILVQMNVEDTRLGVAEYVHKKHKLETIELKWGQGAKCIGGEIKVKTLDRALELKKRGYIVTPDPTIHANQQAFKDGAIKEFERHSRLGFVDEKSFMKEVKRLRDIGFKRITLKTGAYPARELAMAIKYASLAKIDLLTIDGAPGGTGMSPWRMMNEWGIPTVELECLLYQMLKRMDEQDKYIPPVAIAGGLALEDHIFKGIALAAPYVKAICMGRATFAAAMAAKTVGKLIKEGNIPAEYKKYGNTIEQIFVAAEILKAKYGKDFKDIPVGAIGMYTYYDRLATGLKQFMAGERKFALKHITRDDIFALTREASEISGIPYVMDCDKEKVEEILG